MTWSDPTPHRTPPRSKTGSNADPFPDRAPLDHVPVHPTAHSRLPTAIAFVLLASLLGLGAALLWRCWPW